MGIYRPTWTRNGKRQRSRFYWHEWRDGFVRHREKLLLPDGSGVTDRKVAEELAREFQVRREREKKGMVDPFEKHAMTALSEHVNAFEAHLAGCNVTDHHRGEMVRHVNAFIEWCAIARVGELERVEAERWLTWLSKEADGQGKDAAGRPLKLSAAALNKRRQALKRFSRWLVTDRRHPYDAFAGLRCRNEEADRRHERRPLSAVELARLLDAARRRPVEAATRPRKIRGKADVTPTLKPKERTRLVALGETRATIYAFMASTGLRAKETRTLRWRDLDLGDRPTVTVAACFAKNRRAQVLPLEEALADVLEDRRGKEASRDDRVFPVFPTLRVLKADLEHAGIPYDLDGRKCGFHAIGRVTLASALAEAGVHPAKARELLRHGDVNLTLKTYTKVRDADLRGAVETVALGAQLGVSTGRVDEVSGGCGGGNEEPETGKNRRKAKGANDGRRWARTSGLFRVRETAADSNLCQNKSCDGGNPCLGHSLGQQPSSSAAVEALLRAAAAGELDPEEALEAIRRLRDGNDDSGRRTSLVG